MKPDTQQFDLGIYTFKRKMMGSLCPEDERGMKDGSVVALLHPLQNVDPDGMYCFAVDRETGDAKKLCRKNLRFSKVITLSFVKEPLMDATQETWAKLTIALQYLQSKSEQLTL